MTTCTCNGNAPSWAGKDVLALITGATRGFGVSLAEEIVRVMCSVEETSPKSLSLFLIGRQEEMLIKTRELVEAVPRKSATKLDVIFDKAFLLDFATASEQEMEQCIEVYAAYANKFESNNELHLMFNNAATVGDVDKKAHELTSVSRLDRYSRINLTSMITFTSMFLKHVKPLHLDQSHEHRTLCIINVSSLCALLPFKHMSEYCSIKAARMMYMRCLATDREDISLLNYAPGPLKTDMFQELTTIADQDAVKQFLDMELENKVMDPNMSAQECISWLGFLSTPCAAKQGNLCHQHHAEFLGIFTGSQLDYYDSKELPNPYRIKFTEAG